MAFIHRGRIVGLLGFVFFLIESHELKLIICHLRGSDIMVITAYVALKFVWRRQFPDIGWPPIFSCRHATL